MARVAMVRVAKLQKLISSVNVRVNGKKFFPINLSSRELNQDEKSLLSKGPSFCPVPRDVNRVKLLEDWEKFEHRIRATTFFVNQSNSDVAHNESLFPKVKKVSSWKAPVSKFPEVELFLESVKNDLFNPSNFSIVPDNLTAGERRALSKLKTLDQQVIKIQDKGSKFVILDQTEFSDKMLGQLENPLHYETLDSDPSINSVHSISKWSNKWLLEGQIDKDIANWVVNNKPKPGKAFGTIKTHKEGNPLRLITSCCGTAIENLSAFTEYYLKPLAQKLPSFVKDTTHLLQKIEDLNKDGPFPKGTLLVSWDVVSMFPNIDNNLGIKAVTDALNSREIQVPSTPCIVEAVKICLEHNNSNFQGKHFLQIHGTAMGPKNACSYADLAMGVIDQKAKSGTIKPRLWWRYRDDIFDLWTQGATKLNDFTDFINALYPTIKFTVVSSETSLNVLDLTLSLVDGYIQTDVYSKPTDHHMYLLRNSAHPRHCTKAIPFGVATRIRRNCSTIEKFDQRSEEYQTYLVERGYNPAEVNKQFLRAKDLPREDLLASKPKDKKIVFPLVVDYNPHLPNISKIIKSFSHLIYESPLLSQIFPKGSIIPSYRRPKNIKEILARPKKTHYSNNTPVGCFKCSSDHLMPNGFSLLFLDDPIHMPSLFV
ncbi:uncharacterized protein [Montipora foliosa]|uniref:uncharacterized protein n=1 Tax=Montipora foliosa TaxID=591990 RepID=UPI0035F218BB